MAFAGHRRSLGRVSVARVAGLDATPRAHRRLAAVAIAVLLPRLGSWAILAGDVAGNIEWARRAYAAFNRGDVAAGVENFTPEFEWVATGVVPDVEGVDRGPGSTGDSWSSGGTSSKAPTLRSRSDRRRRSGAGLADAARPWKAERRGVSGEIWHVWTLRDGKVVGHQAFTSRAEAIEAAGLSE